MTFALTHEAEAVEQVTSAFDPVGVLGKTSERVTMILPMIRNLMICSMICQFDRLMRIWDICLSTTSAQTAGSRAKVALKMKNKILC